MLQHAETRNYVQQTSNT